MEKVLTSQFDLIVTDVNMPQMDGYEFTRRIRAAAGYETTPIIIVSTESEAQDKTRGFEAGANVYVVKPARPKDLLGNARMLLGTRPATRALGTAHMNEPRSDNTLAPLPSADAGKPFEALSSLCQCLLQLEDSPAAPDRLPAR